MLFTIKARRCKVSFCLIYLFYRSDYNQSMSLASFFYWSFLASEGRGSRSFTCAGPWRPGDHHQVDPADRRPWQPGRYPGHGPWTASPRPADPATQWPGAHPIQAGGAVTGTDPVHPRRDGDGGHSGAAGQRRPQLQEHSPPGPHQSKGRVHDGGLSTDNLLTDPASNLH